MLQNHQVVNGMTCNISSDLADSDIPEYINSGDKILYIHGVHGVLHICHVWIER